MTWALDCLTEVWNVGENLFSIRDDNHCYTRAAEYHVIGLVTLVGTSFSIS